jgi:hypothetical protein
MGVIRTRLSAGAPSLQRSYPIRALAAMQQAKNAADTQEGIRLARKNSVEKTPRNGQYIELDFAKHEG